MKVITGAGVGLALQLVALRLYDASSAEGLLAYAIGFIAGYIFVSSKGGAK